MKSQVLGEFVPIDAEIAEPLVGHPSRETVDPADCLVLSQAARIEIELLHHLQHDAR